MAYASTVALASEDRARFLHVSSDPKNMLAPNLHRIGGKAKPPVSQQAGGFAYVGRAHNSPNSDVRRQTESGR